MNPDLNKNRKLIAFIIAVVATCLLSVTNHVSGDSVEAIFTALIWAFIAGNSAEHVSKNFMRKSE